MALTSLTVSDILFHSRKVLLHWACGLLFETVTISTHNFISQLIRFARASSHVADFNARNKLLTKKLPKQGYRYHKLRKTFSKFYRRYYDLISKFLNGLKSLLRLGFSEPEFYGDLVYKLKTTVCSNNFSAESIPIIKRLAITLMCCNILHAWWSTQSLLVTLLSYFIARRWVRLQTL